MAIGNPFFGGLTDGLRNNSDILLQTGLGLLSGNTPQEQVAGAAQAIAGARQRNKTLQFLQGTNPQLAQAVASGVITPGEAYKYQMQAQLANQKAIQPREFKQLDDGTYGWADPEAGTFTKLGTAAKPRAISDVTTDVDARRQAAQAAGLDPSSPAYNSYILTGKMPREDQQNLTATDKKAILESDDAISTNKSAISLLDQALQINDQANSGYSAGTRAWLGNNLPDYAVPDAVSSPESSAATTEYDNLVQQGALSQLKTIFGGNPTEGERSILLDLQASSNKPPEVRKKILMRAKDLAQRRLELNQTRANQLRGGDFYKPQGGMSGSGGTGNTTSNGVTWSVK